MGLALTFVHVPPAVGDGFLLRIREYYRQGLFDRGCALVLFVVELDCELLSSLSVRDRHC